MFLVPDMENSFMMFFFAKAGWFLTTMIISISESEDFGSVDWMMSLRAS